MKNTLTKFEISDAIHNELGFSRRKSLTIVESLIDIIKGKLETGEDVLISGFGKFCVLKKKKRRGRNPATGRSMMLPARTVVTFKCSGKLRGIINRRERMRSLRGCRMLTFYKRSNCEVGNCDIAMDGNVITVTFKEKDRGMCVWEGKSMGANLYNLKDTDGDGTGYLFYNKVNKTLEGSWKEGKMEGMWKIDLNTHGKVGK